MYSQFVGNFLIGGEAKNLKTKRTTEPWTCPSCNHHNPAYAVKCLGVLDERNPITDQPRNCCTRDPNRPYLADWKHMTEER